MRNFFYIRVATEKNLDCVSLIHNSWSLDRVLPHTERGFFWGTCGKDYFASHIDNPEYDEITVLMKRFFSEASVGIPKGSKRSCELLDFFSKSKREWSCIFSKL